MAYNIASMQARKEVPNREASAVKLFSSELGQHVASVGVEVLGLYGQLEEGSSRAPWDGRLERAYVSAIAATIGGGTSEIQRNVIATRGLGLPR